MAVQEQTPFVEYTANGSTTSFALGFDCESKDHLIVTQDGVETPIGQWSLTGNAVVFSTAPELGVVVEIQRNTPLSRSTDYQSYNNSFKPSSVNKDFDWIWWKLQELWVQITLLWAVLKKEIKDRTDGDLAIRSWVTTLLNNIIDNGLVSSLAVTHVECVADLDDLNKWDGRTVYVDSYHPGLKKGGGVFTYDSTKSSENDKGHVINGWVRKDPVSFNVVNFGAKGDGITDDTSAFMSAATALRANNGGTLFVPKGDYIVGRQEQVEGYAFVGKDILAFYGMTGTPTVHLDAANIKFIDGLYFGSWNRSTNPPTALTSISMDSNYYSSVGSMIYATDIPKLVITGTGTLDGNLDGVQLGGEWGDTGYQCWGNAIKLLNVPDFTIDTRIKTKNFPLDSIYVGNSNYSKDDDGYGTSTIKGVNCDGNARQGLSLCGGSNFIIESCVFKNIGRGTFGSLPKAGIDIEAERGDIRNVKFIACEISNCASYGMNDVNGNIDEVNFENCKFVGTTAHSVLVNRSHFTDCTLYGRVGITARQAEDQKPVFKNCTFSNDPEHTAFGAYLVTTEGAGDMQAEFIDCTFMLHSGQFISKPEANDWRFRHCKFVVPANSTATGDVNKIVGNFNSAIMEDCEFIDLRASGAGYLYISILPQYKNKRNKITSAISRMQFWWDKGVQSISHTPSLDDAIGGVVLARNSRGSVLSNADTIQIRAATAIPTDTVLSPSLTLNYVPQGSIFINSAAGATGTRFWQCTSSGHPCANAWAATTAYTVQSSNAGYVYNAGRVYKCKVAGTSGSTGPTHASGDATDGTVTWTYISPLAAFVAV